MSDVKQTIDAAREYLAAVAQLFDSKASKNGKFLAEMSPLHDQQCFEAFKNLNDTGARLRQCIDSLDKRIAKTPHLEDTDLYEDFPGTIDISAAIAAGAAPK